MYKCHIVGVLCMFMTVFVCFLFERTIKTVSQSQRVTLGLVPHCCAFGASASVYLWTKGCSETNDLAPVSQSRRTRDEKRERSETWKGKMMEAFQGNHEGSRRVKRDRAKERKKSNWTERDFTI